MPKYVTFTLELEVTDEKAMVDAAKLRQAADGVDWDDEEEMDVAIAARILLDPGTSPPGSEIQDSSAEWVCRT
jgi:hypothetical protein